MSDNLQYCIDDCTNVHIQLKANEELKKLKADSAKWNNLIKLIEQNEIEVMLATSDVKTMHGDVLDKSDLNELVG